MRETRGGERGERREERGKEGGEDLSPRSFL